MYLILLSCGETIFKPTNQPTNHHVGVGSILVIVARGGFPGNHVDFLSFFLSFLHKYPTSESSAPRHLIATSHHLSVAVLYLCYILLASSRFETTSTSPSYNRLFITPQTASTRATKKILGRNVARQAEGPQGHAARASVYDSKFSPGAISISS